MKTKFDLSKSNAVIDEYLRELSDDQNKIPGRIGRTWIEVCMERNGMIPDVRQLGFGESHAIWYAALWITGRLREVTNAERKALPNHHARTETSVRRMLKHGARGFDTITGRYFRELIALEKVGK